MTNYIILVLCLVVLIAYLFDITSRFTKIPGIVLLILLGIAIRIIGESAGLVIPNLQPMLPVIGTIGLIMIVMEASLDLKLQKDKIRLIRQSVSAAVLLLTVFVFLFSYILVRFMGFELIRSLLSAIPLGIISSAVAISSARALTRNQQEFIIYESSISDIVGIILFDFILMNHGDIGRGLAIFTFKGLLTVVLAFGLSTGLAFLLHKTSYHVNYVIIMTTVVMVYALAKLVHLPALFLVLVFGLALSNNALIEQSIVRRWVDFDKFRNDVASFQKILGELTFVIRSFFFIMFGYYTSLKGIFEINNLLTAATVTVGLFIIRWIFFSSVLKLPSVPLAFFAPRGLITILLFLSIPSEYRISLISEEVVTLIIFMTIILMMFGNILNRKAEPGTTIRKDGH